MLTPAYAVHFELKYRIGSTYVMDESPIFNGPKFSVIVTDFILFNNDRFSLDASC